MTQGRIDPFKIGNFQFLGCHCFRKNGKNLLLSGNGCIILLDDDLTQSLMNFSPSEALMFKLVQHGIAYVPGKTMFRCEREVEPNYFVIDTTKKCNFDCIYCFRDLNNNNTISFKVLDDILRYILTYCQENNITRIGLQMWGGEPIFALDRIEYVADFFRANNLEATIDVETNGSTVTRDVAKKLFAQNVQVGISLDGTPELHNKQRRLRSGKESSKLVELGIHNIQEFYGENFGGITVVTKYNYQYVKEMLDYYIFKLGLKSMKFNIVRDNDNAGETGLGISEDKVAFFANELLDYLQAYRLMGTNFSEGNIDLRAENLLRRAGTSCCISHGCQGGKKIISFDQKGDIFPCEMTDFPEEKLGSIYDSFGLKEQIKKAMQKKRFFLIKKGTLCGNCPWWYYCRGGCSSRNCYLGKDGEIDTIECTLNRCIYPRLVEWILDGYIR